MSGLLKELGRRNVFRAAGVYAVVGWLLAQVAGTLESALTLPDWFDTVVVAFLLIGFPIVLIFAWAFEMTPEGIKLTAEVPEGESVAAKTGRALDYAILTGLAVVVVLVVADRVMPQTAPAPVGVAATAAADPAAASIAVLPFTDLSPDSDQEYFSDGIAEEILNVLVRFDDLKVASRTSSFGFKGQEALGIPLIAEKLNVRHVLEGSVRKQGESVRITAQLIDAQTDQHLWSETYDRTLTAENLFAIQDDIANAIVAQLGLVIDSADGAPAINIQADTQDLDAYEAFLEARALFTARNNLTLPEIIAIFEHVVDQDPNFARGWAGLSAAYMVSPSWGIMDRDYKSLADEAAERAIGLNPNLALPYAVRGLSLLETPPFEFAAAFAEFDEAIARDPNDTDTLQWRGEAHLRVGFFARATADFERCTEIDPDYLQCRVWRAKVKFLEGKADEGFALFEDAVSRGAVGGGAFHYPMEYAHAGHDRAARLSLAAVFQRFSYLNGRSLAVYRALTDPNFDFDTEAKAFEVEWLALRGDDFLWNGPLGLAFKRYDLLTPANEPLWWYRTDPEFLKSPHRKRLIREAGVYDYWRAAGFPPQCRRVGGDDFACD